MASLQRAVAIALLATAGALTPKRVVLVTGANKGIGKEIARTIGKLPDHAVLLGCRDLELAEEAAAALRASGCDDVHKVRVDLTDASSFDAMVKGTAMFSNSRCPLLRTA